MLTLWGYSRKKNSQRQKCYWWISITSLFPLASWNIPNPRQSNSQALCCWYRHQVPLDDHWRSLLPQWQFLCFFTSNAVSWDSAVELWHSCSQRSADEVSHPSTLKWPSISGFVDKSLTEDNFKEEICQIEKVNCLTICVMCIIWCATSCNFYWLLHLQDQRMLWRQGTATVRLCEITATRPARTSDIALTCQTLPRRAQNVAKSKSEGRLYDIISTLTSSSHNVFYPIVVFMLFFKVSEVHPSTLRHLAKGILRPKAALIVKTFNAKGSSGHQTTWSIQCMKNDLVKSKLPSKKKVHFRILYNIII